MGDLADKDWLASEARAVRGWLTASIAFALLATAAIIAQAGAMAHLVALALDGTELSRWRAPVAVLAIAVTARALGQWGQSATGTAAAARVKSGLRRRLWDRIGALGPVGTHDFAPGDAAARVLDRVDALEGYFARFRPQLVVSGLAPLAILVVVASLDWLAAILLLAAAPLIPLFMALVGMGADELNRRQAEWVNHLSGHFLDRVRGLVTLQLFDREGAAVADVEHGAQSYRRLTLRTLRVAFLSSAVLEFFASVAIAVIAIYIGFALLGAIGFGPADELTLYAGLFVLLLAPEFFQPLRNLAQHYHDRAAALGAVPSIRAVLERASPAADDTAAQHDGGARRIVFDAVDLGYGDGASVLHSVECTVEPGERVLLTGPSGGGKSTLLAAIAGFLAPTAGRIQGTGPCAWLGQRPWLLPGSLRDNLRVGDPEATEAAVERAADAADVSEFAQRTPAGLDARVGEGGHGLSGGQSQRVALARAFLSPAPVVVLDEPTAKLDPAAAERVIAGLQRLVEQQRTVIIASHDPRLQRLAQRRLHVADGAVREVALDA